MKRLRLSGCKTYGKENIKCSLCGKIIIKDGEPMVPIYYEDKLHRVHCSGCASRA